MGADDADFESGEAEGDMLASGVADEVMAVLRRMPGATDRYSGQTVKGLCLVIGALAAASDDPGEIADRCRA